VGKVTFWAARPFVQITWPRANGANPAGIGLGGNGVAEVLQAIQHIHGTMFDSVFVAGNQTAADFAIVGILPCLVQKTRVGVQPLNYFFGLAAIVAQPNRPSNDQNVSVHNFFVNLWPLVNLGSVFTHIWINTVS